MKQGCGRRERGVRRERVLFCMLYSVFCILFFTGCAVKQKVSSSDPQLDSLQIFSRVRELKPINTFKGVGSLEIISGGLLHTSRVVIAAKSPHSFRIEFLNPLNQPSAVIVNNGQGYQFYYSGKIYKGTALPGYFPLQDLKYIPLYIIGWSVRCCYHKTPVL
ncbi:MAG: hypothetical protein HZC45_01655 [Deltaproteobacteria bacterium]|nr:hypothetical protein [Deltaproteobacteria bacterium]